MRLVLIVFLIHCAVFEQSLAYQTLSSYTGGSFGRGSREPRYNIKFHSGDSPFQPEDDQESLVMPGRDGKNYLCYLPKEEKVKSGTPNFTQNTTGLIMENEKQVKLKTPDELLEVLKGRCFLRDEGWWSFEFCFNQKIRQFHVEGQKVVQEYILGYHDQEMTSAYNDNLSNISTLKDPRSKDASRRYHTHHYTNGTICDLTNQPRETEVRFVCSEPRAMISSITELSTCKYALTVQCPMICNHPLYQEERQVWQTINCNFLPKTQKEKGAEGETINHGRIIMVGDTESPSVGEEIE